MKSITVSKNIQDKIYTIRGQQVLLDKDLAELYGVSIKRLNEQVKRNSERFPEEFMFQLNQKEFEVLRSQIATLNFSRGKHRKYLPYAFTEQGIAMLSAVLRSETAVKVSIQIMNVFVKFRRLYKENSQLFERLSNLEIKQFQTEIKIEKVLTAIDNKSIKLRQGIFYNGQIFDAWQFVSDLIRTAEKSIILIDNYIDDSVLSLFCKRKESVKVTIFTRNISKQLRLDLKKFNEQYPVIMIKQFTESHDRFLIIDEKILYHIGASLKDLGKKWFAFSKMDFGVTEIIEKLNMK